MEQFSIYCESNQGFFLLCFTSLCDWLRKLATLSRPNRFNTTTNGELVTPFSRALGNLLVFILSSHEMFSFLLIGCCQYFGSSFTTLNRKVLQYRVLKNALFWENMRA